MAGGCKQEFSSIQAAAEYGDRYKIGADARARILDIYETYRGWIDRYRGGVSPLGAASGMSWESRGDPLKFTPGKAIKEIGLWSITEGVAKNLDIDPFDPEANIWAGAHLRNDRVRQIMQDTRFNWLRDADAYDWTKLVWKLPGSLGLGGWRILMLKAFPTPPPVGRDQRRYPYDALRDWMLDHPGQVPKLGGMWPTLVACRVFRHHGVDFLRDVGQLSLPGYYKVIPRPSRLPRWNEAKFDAVVATPANQRLARFPEYNRFPAPVRETRAGAIVAGVIGGATALGLGGYALWRHYRG